MSFLRRPVATTDAGTPDWVMLTSGINDFPTCQVSYHYPRGQVAVRAVASEIAAQAAADQLLSFAPRFEADASVHLEDGKGGVLDFEGFKTAPSHRIGVGGVGSSISIIHSMSLIGAYAPYIYEAEVFHRDDINPTAGNLAERATTMLEAMTTAWQGEGRDRGIEEYEEIKDSLHANNQKVEGKVKELLKASADTTAIDGLSEITTHGGLNLGVNSSILKCLTSRRSNFFDNITELCATWQLMYQPDKSAGGVGKIIRMEDALNLDVQEREVAVIDFLISAGPLSIMPVTGVIVEGLPAGEHRSGGDEDDTTKYGIVPNSIVTHGNAEGRMATAPLPPFLQRPLHTSFLTDGVDMTDDGYDAAQEAQVSDLDDIIGGPVKALAEQWAKNHYIDLVLAPSNVSLTCELDLSWQAGKTYKVKAENSGGAVLFQGLLNREQHTISTRGQQATAETHLYFSHVLILGNTLPHAE
jgi:hypothetical protein